MMGTRTDVLERVTRADLARAASYFGAIACRVAHLALDNIDGEDLITRLAVATGIALAQ